MYLPFKKQFASFGLRSNFKLLLIFFVWHISEVIGAGCPESGSLIVEIAEAPDSQFHYIIGSPTQELDLSQVFTIKPEEYSDCWIQEIVILDLLPTTDQ